MGNLKGLSYAFLVFLPITLAVYTGQPNSTVQPDELAPLPLVAPVNREIQNLEQTIAQINNQILLHKMYLKALSLKGTQGLAEILAWYDLFPKEIKRIILEYYNSEDARSAGYWKQAWAWWLQKRGDKRAYCVWKPKGQGHTWSIHPTMIGVQPRYKLKQQIFLQAFFTEVNMNECDLPQKKDGEIYTIYASFRSEDKFAMIKIKRNMAKIHTCNNLDERIICDAHIAKITNTWCLSGSMYYHVYPRVLDVNDAGELIIQCSGTLGKTCLVVRTMAGKQRLLGYIPRSNQLYEALWCNDGSYIVSIGKVEAEDAECQNNVAQNLDPLVKNGEIMGPRDSPDEEVSRSYNSSSSQSNKLSNLSCVIWSWPQLKKVEDALVVNNFDAYSYDHEVQEENVGMHNRLFSQYNPDSRCVDFIIPAYKNRWNYCFTTNQLTMFPMNNMCANVVISKGLKYAICPDRSSMEYGSFKDNYSFSKWHKAFNWKTCYRGSSLRSYNVTDEGYVIGLTQDGNVIRLPSGQTVLSLGREKIIRDDWPVIFSAHNQYVMIPTKSFVSKPPYVNQTVTWVLCRILDRGRGHTEPLPREITNSDSDRKMNNNMPRSSSGNHFGQRDKDIRDYCITM